MHHPVADTVEGVKVHPGHICQISRIMSNCAVIMSSWGDEVLAMVISDKASV